MSLFSSFLEDYLAVSQGGEWVVRVLVAFTDPFQERANTRLFGHPTRNTFGLVTRIVGFCTTTRTATWSLGIGPFAKVVRNMKITVEITCFSHMGV